MDESKEYQEAREKAKLNKQSGRRIIIKEVEKRLREVEQELEATKAQLGIRIETWNTLYSCFGERMQRDELDLMDGVLQGVTFDTQDKIQQQEE